MLLENLHLSTPASREAVETLIEELIGVLDAFDPDPDLELDDPGEDDDPKEDDLEDCCIAADDGCAPVWRAGHLYWGSQHDEEHEPSNVPC